MADVYALSMRLTSSEQGRRRFGCVCVAEIAGKNEDAVAFLYRAFSDVHKARFVRLFRDDESLRRC